MNLMRSLNRGLSFLSDRLYAHDVFVSYAWRDWTPPDWSPGDAPPAFPIAVANKLRSSPYDYKVFLDQDDYTVGTELKEATRLRVSASRVLVLLLRSAALNSTYVLQEVQTCIESGRTPFVLNFDRTFESADPDNPLRQLLSNETRDFLRISSAAPALDSELNDDLVQELTRHFTFTRTQTMRLRWIRGVAMLLLVALALTLVFWRQAVAARGVAEQEALRSRIGELAAESTAAREEFPQRSLLLAAEVSDLARSAKSVDNRATQVLFNALARVSGRGFPAHNGPIRDVAVSPDGAWLLTVGDDRQVCLWRLSAGQVIGRPSILTGHSEAVTTASFTSDGRWGITVDKAGKIRLWDMKSDTPETDPVTITAHMSPPDGPLYSHDSWTGVASLGTSEHWLVSGGRNHRACVVELEDVRSAERLLERPGVWFSRVLISERHGLIACATWEKAFPLWRLESDDVHPFIELEHEATVREAALSPDERWLATGNEEGGVAVFDLNASYQEGPLWRAQEHGAPVDKMRFSPDSRSLLTSDENGNVRVWALEGESATSRDLSGHLPLELLNLTFSADSQLAATVGQYDATRVWNLARPQAPPVVLGGLEGIDSSFLFKQDGDTGRTHAAILTQGAFTPDGRWFVGTPPDGSPRLWRLGGEQRWIEPIVLYGHESIVDAFAISPDSSWLYTGDRAGMLRWWRIGSDWTSASPQSLMPGEGEVFQVLFSPDSRRLVCRCSNGDERVYEWRLQPFEGFYDTGIVNDVNWLAAVSSQGRWIVVHESTTHTWWLYDLGTSPAKAVRLLARGPSELDCWFSADEKMLFTIDTSGQITLVPLTALQLPVRVVVKGVAGQAAPVVAGNEQTLVVIAPDDQIHVVSASTGRHRIAPFTIPDLERFSVSLELSPDGHWLSMMASGELRLVKLPKDGTHEVLLKEHDVNSASFSAGSHWLLIERDGQGLELRSLQDHPAPPTVLQHYDDVYMRSLAFPRAIAARERGPVVLWDLSGPKPPSPSGWTLEGHKSLVHDFCFDENHNTLITADYDGEIRLWKLTADCEPPTSTSLLAHEAKITWLDLCSDDRLLVSGDETGRLALWDVQTPTLGLPLVLEKHGWEISASAVSPDGRWFAAGDIAGHIAVWRLREEELTDLARTVTGRPLTNSERLRFRLEDQVSD